MFLRSQRTLTCESVGGAIKRLEELHQLLDTYDGGLKGKTTAIQNAGGPTMSVATRAPLLGVMGLAVQEDSFDNLKNQLEPEVRKMVDIVWAPASSFFARHSVTDAQGNHQYPNFVTRGQEGVAESMIAYHTPDDPASAFGAAVSAYRYWVNKTSGSPSKWGRSPSHTSASADPTIRAIQSGAGFFVDSTNFTTAQTSTTTKLAQ